MKCKSCGRKIEENSIFCNWCGEKQLKTKKKKNEIRVPAPKQLKSGQWNIYLRAEKASITEKTPELCVAKATAVRAGFLDQKQKYPAMTVSKAITGYIEANSNVLSPSTLRGYTQIRDNRFKDYQSQELWSVNWQEAVNAEAALVAPKTVRNAWGLIARVLRYYGQEPPPVITPQVPAKELPWLDDKQIKVFLKAVKGTTCEFAALLALHSLRRSEIVTITPAHIKNNRIIVRGAMVQKADNSFVAKETNKNKTSARSIPIMIPRLAELIKASKNKPDEPYVSTHAASIYQQINTVCRRAGLPEVGVHGLRRSFASLAYHLGWQERKTMQIGGWADFNTMHKIYIKLSDADINNGADSMKSWYENP